LLLCKPAIANAANPKTAAVLEGSGTETIASYFFKDWVNLSVFMEN